MKYESSLLSRTHRDAKEPRTAMAALQALKGLTAQLSSAGSAEDIGRALVQVSKPFGFATVLIVDTRKIFDRIGPAIVFVSADRAKLEVFDRGRPFVDHPFTMQARESDKPFVMSDVREQSVVDGDDFWWAALPPHLKDTDGLVVPVHEAGELAWYTGFAGAVPDLSQVAQSVIVAAVHASYARFQELLDSSSPRSPLSPRESECLHWVSSGKTDFEVGRILSISPRTVRFHINNAKTKLGVTTRIQAVAKRASGAA